MKLLGIKRNSSGSAYHRLILPMSQMGADFATQPTEDLFRMYDSIWIHYKTVVHPTQLAMWRAQYGTQIVLDIDDTWNIPLNHPSYKTVQESARWSKYFAVVADWVVCSTPEVEDMVKPYNKNTVVIPNRIPYGEGQYHIVKESKESFMNRKIRIGFCGSISHLEDWESISGKLKRVIQDTEVRQKCEFVICGVPDFEKLPEPDWIEDKINSLIGVKYKDTPENRETLRKSMFKGYVDYNKGIWKRMSKSLGNPIVINGRPVENYIDLYREVDILLCPLVDNDLNRKKSSLKVLEAACTDTLCILGNLYKGKGQECDYHLYENWYDNIKTLIKNKENLYEKKIDISEKIRNLYDYHSECVIPRQELIGKRKELDLNIYGITYKDGQSTEYKEYRNTVNSIENKSYFFEANPIKNLFESEELKGDYVGVFSHKFPLKTKLSADMVEYLIKGEDVDVINFCKYQTFNDKKGNSFKYLEFTEIVHPGFMEGFKYLCDFLGLSVREPKCVIYSGQWVAKEDVYKRYVREILIPAMDYMETDDKMKRYAWRDSKYSERGGLKKEELKKYTGLDYYPMTTFLLERLPSIWIDNANLTWKIKTEIL